jgi:hypothetical protein
MGRSSTGCFDVDQANPVNDHVCQSHVSFSSKPAFAPAAKIERDITAQRFAFEARQSFNRRHQRLN